MRTTVNGSLLSIIAAMAMLQETPRDASGSGEVKMSEETGAEAEETTAKTKRDKWYGSEEQKEAIATAVAAGHIKLIPQTKTQKTRGKGSRELTYKWDDIEFTSQDGLFAYIGSSEERLLTLMSDVASDQNQQAAWEELFGVSDEDKLLRQAAKRIAQALGISEDEALANVKAMVESKRQAAPATV